MTFNTSLKEEISKNEYSLIEARCELEAFIKSNSKITNKSITITVENASVARKIYKNIKKVFNISANIIVRIQNRFRVKQIYILEINKNNLTKKREKYERTIYCRQKSYTVCSYQIGRTVKDRHHS